jgi:hypothetical protein
MRRFIILSTLATALLVAAGAAAVNPAEGVRFSPVARSGVTGTATLAANGIGTKVNVRLVGLAPGTTARVLLRTGRYPRLSASFAKAVDATSDVRGVARASSAVRFRGEPVSWTIVADGDHVLTVVAGGKLVAYATIPGMD